MLNLVSIKLRKVRHHKVKLNTLSLENHFCVHYFKDTSSEVCECTYAES